MGIKSTIKAGIKEYWRYRCYRFYSEQFKHYLDIQHLENKKAEGEDEYLQKWKALSSRVEPYSYRFFSHYLGFTPNIVPEDIGHSIVEEILNPLPYRRVYEDKNIFPDLIGKENVPRTIQLIGTPAYNSEGTIVLGTAEGGLKVTLYMVNSLTNEVLRDYSTINEYYFHTMHHEFTHILTQKKPYNTAFDLISESDYISGDWYQQTDNYARQHGFVTAYAMSEPNEDFAEMMSVYVTSSDEEWQNIIDEAGNGATAINDKLAILRNYMLDSWNLDINEMRAAIQHRARELGQLDLQHLN